MPPVTPQFLHLCMMFLSLPHCSNGNNNMYTFSYFVHVVTHRLICMALMVLIWCKVFHWGKCMNATIYRRAAVHLQVS